MKHVRIRILTVVFCLVSLISTVFSDVSKKPLDHSDYDRWNTASMVQISNDGHWIQYVINSGKPDGDATLVLRKNGAPGEYKIARGESATFTFDSRFVIYKIAPDPERVEELKKEKTKPEDLPKPVLEVLELESGASYRVDRIKSFSVPKENGRWLAYLLEKPLVESHVETLKSGVEETYEVTPQGLRRPAKPMLLKKRPTETSPEEKSSPDPDPKKEKMKDADHDHDESTNKKDKEPGTVLAIRNLQTNEERRFSNVVDYQFSKDGNAVAFVTSVESLPDTKDGTKISGKEIKPKSSITDGVYVLNLKNQKLSQILSGSGRYKNLSFSDNGEHLTFVTDKDDDESKTSSWSLYHWKKASGKARLIASEDIEGIPAGWWISPDATPYFSDDCRRLFFFTAPVPKRVIEERNQGAEEEAKENKDEEKKAKLDIWHWEDPLLQPEQLLQADKEKSRSYVAVYDLEKRTIIQLANQELPSVSIDRRSRSPHAVAVNDLPYRKLLSWDRPGFQDTYLVNLETGSRTLILEKSRARGTLSPEGNYITWFDPEDRQWYATSTGPDRTVINISKGIGIPLQEELHDTPSLPGAYGSAGWIEKDHAFLIYDRFDIWQVDPTGELPPVCLTEGHGRAHSVQFRFVQLDHEARAIDPEKDMYLSAFNETSKASGYFVIRAEDNEVETSEEVKRSRLEQRIMLNENVNSIAKARNSEDLVFRRNTFRQCPDIWTSTTEFRTIHRISDINPQQDEYAWGDVELIQWKATDGQMLDGLLYKPDDFDPAKKYPLLVYFYERRSDNLHSYYAPAAGRSIINFSFYVSRGYVLFVPDIPYKMGIPGQSALNSVVSGTQSLIDKGFIDEKRIGIQGHSWGGYQAAYLVTKTDMFACAEAGAPVSNMTSAYGGIRWGTGLSRMFQYERTQSRIGDTLWNARDQYIENSPLFSADKINTPLLILHNDEDGAVPWYQGIELFVALRRLEKPAWLLNYNGDPHWVMGEENRRDFAIRMQQFFDHYLKDAPEPEWMAVGVPAVEKGENFGLELLEPKSQVE
jgi:dipeptidyl aminopeptidase/acylaminoacyl peptidase